MDTTTEVKKIIWTSAKIFKRLHQRILSIVQKQFTGWEKIFANDTIVRTHRELPQLKKKKTIIFKMDTDEHFKVMNG